MQSTVPYKNFSLYINRVIIPLINLRRFHLWKIALGIIIIIIRLATHT